jgi:hypothetical protein
LKREVAMPKFRIDVKIKSRLSVLYSFILLLSILFYFIPGSGIKANTSTKVNYTSYTSNTLNVSNSKSSLTPYLYWEKVFNFCSTTSGENISVFQNLIVPKSNLLYNNITYSSGILTAKI